MVELLDGIVCKQLTFELDTERLSTGHFQALNVSIKHTSTLYFYMWESICLPFHSNFNSLRVIAYDKKEKKKEMS